MKPKIAHLLALPLAIVLAAVGAHSAPAEEAAAQGKGAPEAEFVSCNPWMNCDTESPNYTGVCCRTCKDAASQTIWDCKECRKAI